MPRIITTVLCLLFTSSLFAQEFREITIEDYRDKMKAGWIGQIAGVCWGAPTEFKFQEQMIPEDKMPVWKPEMINHAFGQDDLYVEMTFLRTMELYGFDVSQRQAGIDFANSGYQLWHANVEGRKNLRRGIAPPDSGHPAFNCCADDIDYQIEADFSGLIAPGMPKTVIELGDKFGGIMNYGDGLYAGQFVGGMYAEAFFETDLRKIIAAGLMCIPQDSQYAQMVRDALRWFDENPYDWTYCWTKIEEKYQKNPEYRKFSCNPGKFNIDAKINGAHILVGMLYGKGDLDKTIVLSTRCGQDSDCNPSNAAGVLFTTLGFSKLPPRFSEKLDEKTKFSYTEYNFPALLDVCEKLARQAVVKNGGSVEKDFAGKEYFRIPVRKPEPGPYVPTWKPEPPKNVRFTDEEYKQIEIRDYKLDEAIAKFFPGWTLADCGPDMSPGYREEYFGRKNVVMTHPKARGKACVLSKTVELPKDKLSRLKLVVAAHEAQNAKYDWDLIVKINGGEILKQRIVGGWSVVLLDLARYSGQKVKIELLNAPNDWACEAGYWHEIDLVTE